MNWARSGDDLANPRNRRDRGNQAAPGLGVAHRRTGTASLNGCDDRGRVASRFVTRCCPVCCCRPRPSSSPLYYNLRTVGLTDTYLALIMPQAAQSLAFGIFWMRNQFRMFPTEIMEAGRLDGATDWRLLWRIMVPPSTPAIITMCLLVSMWTWNEFLTR